MPRIKVTQAMRDVEAAANAAAAAKRKRSRSRRAPQQSRTVLQQLAAAEAERVAATKAAERAAANAARAERAAKRAERREAILRARAQRQRVEQEPQIMLSARFYAPHTDKDKNHYRELIPKKDGSERKHVRDHEGYVYHEVQHIIRVVVPRSAVQGIQEGQVYWSEDAGAAFTPTISIDHAIFRASAVLAKTWQHMTQSGTCGVKFDQFQEYDPQEQQQDIMEQPLLDSGSLVSTYSKWMVTPATYLLEVLSPETQAAVHDAKRARTLGETVEEEAAEATMHRGRACVVDLLIARYGEMVRRYQEGEIDERRRFVGADGKPSITFNREGLWRYWHPTEPYPGDDKDFPVTLFELRCLMEQLRTRLVVLFGRGCGATQESGSSTIRLRFISSNHCQPVNLFVSNPNFKGFALVCTRS